MSADNWAVCPKCKTSKEALRSKQLEQTNQSYGQLPKDEFLRKLQQASVPLEHEHTLREDYDIGVYDNGRFEVSYGCSCSECNFHFNFKHSVKVLTKPNNPAPDASIEAGKEL